MNSTEFKISGFNIKIYFGLDNKPWELEISKGDDHVVYNIEDLDYQRVELIKYDLEHRIDEYFGPLVARKFTNNSEHVII